MGKRSKFMIKEEDRKILEYLKANGNATVEKLSEVAYCSLSTVRRKLTTLQSQGLITRTHGGAKINDEDLFVPAFEYRVDVNALGKKRMATAAVKLVKEGDVIFLDGSTSAFYMVKYLADIKNLTVVTNGIDALSLLSKMHMNVYSTGGVTCKNNPSVLTGEFAERAVEKINADIVFFSTLSLNSDGIISDNSPEENAVRRRMIENSAKKVFLCDGEKFGTRSPFRLCGISDMDYVVTDKNLKDALDESVRILPEIIICN